MVGIAILARWAAEHVLVKGDIRQQHRRALVEYCQSFVSSRVFREQYVADFQITDVEERSTEVNCEPARATARTFACLGVVCVSLAQRDALRVCNVLT